ncbi:MAG: S1C family serine protease [Bryobacteraceae bacterium]
MKIYRAAFLASLLVFLFVLLTTRPPSRLAQLFGPVREAGRLWSEPDSARTAGLTNDELNNIDIYKTARNATVNITSTVYRRNWFFEVYPSKDQGSGFLIGDDGKILTNSHVLQGQGKIQVTLPNHDIFDAQVLARDPRNDLALIRISSDKKLPFLRLGDSDSLEVGQKVLAIGNPFGFEGTLTTGVVSSIGRTIRGDRNLELEGMIQTDAAINPGNSGGPLLDSTGNVIGINTAIFGSGGNIGIGFAMPINRAKTMLDEFQSGRSFSRPWLGVSVVHVAGDLAEALDLPAEGGLLVQEVVRGSAAQAAGIRGPQQIVAVGNIQLGVGGDLIMAIDGSPADRIDALSRALNRKRAGEEIELTIYRNGRKITQNVTLGEDPREPI